MKPQTFIAQKMALLLVATIISISTFAQCKNSFTSLGLTSWKTVDNAGAAGVANRSLKIALDYNNTPYVVYCLQTWVSVGGTNRAVYTTTVRKYNGNNWTTEFISTSQSLNIDIAIGHNNVPYIVYKDSASNSKAVVKKYNGSTWIAVGSAVSSGDAYFPTIAMDENGVPYVAYGDATNSGIVTVKKYNGTNWEQVGVVGTSSAQYDVVGNPKIAIDRNGTPYIGYKATSQGSIAVVKKFNGSNWLTVGTAGFSASVQNFADIAIDSSGIPYVVSQEFINSAAVGIVRKFNGSSWGVVGGINNLPGGNLATIAIGNDNQPYVSYQGNSTVRKFNGSNWTTVGDSAFTGAIGSLSSIAIDNNGTPYVAYQDNIVYAQSTTVKKLSQPTVTACNGYSFNGTLLSQNGTYFDTLVNVAGCDSIVQLNLEINHNDTATINTTSCNNYIFRDSTYILSGTYYYHELGASLHHCDSVYKLNLVINHKDTTNITQVACDSFYFNNSFNTISGTLYDTITTLAGCDSVIRLSLVINHSKLVNVSDSICADSSYNFNGTLLTQAGTYHDTLQTFASCDSIVTLTLSRRDCPQQPSGIIETEKISLFVYPNPFTNVLNIVPNIQYQLFDLLGKEVDKNNLSKIPAGTYFLRTDKSTIRVIKIEK